MALTPPLLLASEISTREKISFFGVVKGIPGCVQVLLDTELKSIIDVDEENMYAESINNR